MHEQPLSYVIVLTSKDGSEATVEGQQNCIHALEMALTQAGWLYHEPSGTWDEGYYKEDHLT